MAKLLSTLLCLLALPALACAQPVYRCAVNGAMSYSQSPCENTQNQSCKGDDGHWSASACKASSASTSSNKTVPNSWKATIGMSRQELEAVSLAMDEQCADATRHFTASGEDKLHRLPGGDWGTCHSPTINKTTTAHGVHEQWVWGEGWRRKYVYVDDGVVTSIQEATP